jgi:carbamoyltransferase
MLRKYSMSNKMTYILGIYGMDYYPYPSVHNSAACLLDKNNIIAAAEEERFTRKKKDGSFPANAINFCLNKAQINLDEVDYITFPWMSPSDSIIKISKSFISNRFLFKKSSVAIPSLFLKGLLYFLKNGIDYDIKRHFGNYIKKVNYIDHHLSHAASAFYCSGFNKSNILTFDSKGETCSTFLGLGEANFILEIEKILYPNSLGDFYAAFSQLFGFDLNDGGKLMGLSSYGKPNVDLSDIIKFNNGSYENNLKYFYHFSLTKPYYRVFSKNLERKFYLDRRSKEFHYNLAASIQKKIEDITLELVRRLTEKTNSKNLSLAGGVALNCKLNQALRESNVVKSIFIQPVAYDAGTSLGSALYLLGQLGYKPNIHMKHVYFGPEYDNEEIKNSLQKFNAKFEYYDDISGICAERLAKNKIVGWFQGKMEFGPRALGNRSILMSPSKAKNKDILNLKVKHRENFRPFGPTILYKSADEYLINVSDSPFMITSFYVKNEKREEIPAVVHVDGTVRPQLLRKSINIKYYKLIEAFESITGVPLILNTSFNIAGEPIVCSPKDALNTFYNSGIEYLCIGNYLVSK